MPKHSLIVYNPAARTTAEPEAWLPKIVEALCEREDHVVSFFATDQEKTIEHLVPLLEPPLDLVIAAGGDGTIRFTLAALAHANSNIPAGIIPLGTANVLARNLGIVEESFFANPLKHAIEAIVTGKPTRIDLGRMNGEYFAVTAGAGPMSDAFVVPGREEKTNFKMLAYASAMIQTISLPPVIFQITADGISFNVEASGIFVSNVEDMGLGKESDMAALQDGTLDLNIMNPKNFKDYVEIGFRFAGGFVGGNAPYYVRRVKSAQIEVVPVSGRPSRFQQMGHRIRKVIRPGTLVRPGPRREITAMIDGEEWGTTPMDVEIVPQAVNVLVPPRSEESRIKDEAEAIALQNMAQSLHHLSRGLAL